MKIILPALLLLLPAISYAHAGHGESGTLAHELHHLIWIFAGLSLVLIGWIKMRS